jgi:hypothetical protein
MYNFKKINGDDLMTHIISTFFDQKNKLDLDMDRCAERFNTWGNQIPGFFTPFKNTKDFLETITNPVTEPLFFGVASTLAGVAASLSAVVCVAGMGLGGFGVLLNKPGAKDQGCAAIKAGAVFFAIGAAVSLATALSVVCSLIADLIKIGTRSAVTIGNTVSNLFTSNSESTPSFSA